MPEVAASVAGLRASVPDRLGVLMPGLKALGPLEPRPAFGSCCRGRGRHARLWRLGRPRLGHFARVPAAVSLRRGGRCGVPARLSSLAGGFKALGPLEPRPRNRTRRFRRGCPGTRRYVPGPRRFQVPRLPSQAVVAGFRGSAWPGGLPGFRLQHGVRGFRLRRRTGLQGLPGVKAAGPLEPRLACGLDRRWLSTRLRVRLRRGSHLCQLPVDLPGPLPGLGELGGPGKASPMLSRA